MDSIELADFYSDKNLFLIPSYLSEDEKRRIEVAWGAQGLSSHVFILSSGTSSGLNFKSYAIKKSAIIQNACSVNRFLNAKQSDIWLSSLPVYHIGGLSIFIRAFEAGAKVVRNYSKWNPEIFVKTLRDERISLTSIVPTQLFDIVSNKLPAPKSLRGIFVGGDFLSSKIKQAALDLDWPIIQTYGMTELSSQIASSFSKTREDSFLELLDIHEIQKENNIFKIKSPSLFSREIIISKDQVVVNKLDGDYFVIKDGLEVKYEGESFLVKALGRNSDDFKLKGRLYNFSDLREEITSVLLEFNVFKRAEIIIVEDERDGKAIELWAQEDIKHDLDQLESAINNVLPKVLKIRRIKLYKNLPRTELGKLKFS